MVEAAAQLVDDLRLLGTAGLRDGQLAQELNVARVGIVELVPQPVNDGSEEALGISLGEVTGDE
jgi:orotate phosphoribosyltransferase-like protein